MSIDNVDQEFLNMIVMFAHERKLSPVFYCTSYGEWVCRFSFLDMNGPFQAELPAYTRVRSGKFKEEPGEFEARIRHQCSVAIAKARSLRIGGKAQKAEAENVN